MEGGDWLYMANSWFQRHRRHLPPNSVLARCVALILASQGEPRVLR